MRTAFAARRLLAACVAASVGMACVAASDLSNVPTDEDYESSGSGSESESGSGSACADGEYRGGNVTTCTPKKTHSNCSDIEKFEGGEDSNKTVDDTTCIECEDGSYKFRPTSCKTKKKNCKHGETFTAGSDADKTQDDTTCTTTPVAPTTPSATFPTSCSDAGTGKALKGKPYALVGTVTSSAGCAKACAADAAKCVYYRIHKTRGCELLDSDAGGLQTSASWTGHGKCTGGAGGGDTTAGCAKHSGNGKFKDCTAAKCAFDPSTKTCSAAGPATPTQGGAADDCAALSGKGKYKACTAAKCAFDQSTQTCSAAGAATPTQGGAADNCAALSGNGKYKACTAAKCAFDHSTKTCSASPAAPAKPQQATAEPSTTVAPAETPPQTDAPAVVTTAAATDAPTDAPTAVPTNAPTAAPTDAPTDATTCADHSGKGKLKDCTAAKCAFDLSTKICSIATAKPAQGGNKPAQGGNKPAQGGNKPAQGGNKPAQGGNKP